MSALHRSLAAALACSLALAGWPARAQWISTEAVAAAAAPATTTDARARLAGWLNRGEVVAALAERGVDVKEARARVAALPDADAQALLAQIDSAPAGGESVLGVVVFVFVLLLITDILGFTKVFPFTRPVR